MRLTTSIPRQGTRPRYRRSLTWLMLRGQAMHPAIAQRFSALAHGRDAGRRPRRPLSGVDLSSGAKRPRGRTQILKSLQISKPITNFSISGRRVCVIPSSSGRAWDADRHRPFPAGRKRTDRIAGLVPAVECIEDGDAIGPQTIASPSRVNDLTRSLAAAAAMAGYRSVQSWPRQVNGFTARKLDAGIITVHNVSHFTQRSTRSLLRKSMTPASTASGFPGANVAKATMRSQRS
jgi:hypothetical protein